MAEILTFPDRRQPSSPPRLYCISGDDCVSAGDVEAAIEAETHGRQRVAKAIEHLCSASLELSVVNFLSVHGGDSVDQVSDEVMIGICHALIAVIDAKGCRTDDRALRNAAAKAIADREGIYHDS